MSNFLFGGAMPSTFGDRAQRALLTLAAREGRKVGLAEFGARVATAEGRPAPYTATAVSRWLNDRQEPTLAVVRAMATVLGVDPGELAFGRGASLAAEPPATPARGVPVEDAIRALEEKARREKRRRA